MTIVNIEVTPKNEILSTMQEWLVETLGDAIETMLPELAEMFLDDGPTMMNNIHQAILARDAVALKEAAHSVKGSCASMGLVVLANHYQIIENCAKRGDFETAVSIMPRVEAEYNQVIKLFQELV